LGAYENQHYIPRSYLKHWAYESKVMVRERGAEPVSGHIGKVASEKHLYSLRLPDGTRDNSAENTLREYEGAAAQALDALRHGGEAPRPHTSGRHGIALFLGLQMVRTPERVSQLLFPARVVEHAGTDEPTRADVREFLRLEYGFEPGDADVQGAHDFVMGLRAMGALHITKRQRLNMMFEHAVKELAPAFEAMSWSVEHCAVARFVTCDRLPALWRTPTERDQIEGVGVAGAEEVWLPLDPRNLLVLRHSGTDGRLHFGPERARLVNHHLARHCYRAVFHDPREVVSSDEMRCGRNP
jgi:hypothetical protein